MKPCEYESAQISLLIDGLLTPSEEAELRLHLEVCAACAEKERELRAIKEFLGSDDENDIPPELHEHIMSALPPIRRKRMFEKSWVKAIAAVAACAVLALVFVRLPRSMKSMADSESSMDRNFLSPAPPASEGADADKAAEKSDFSGQKQTANDLCAQEAEEPLYAQEAEVPSYSQSYVYTGDVNQLKPEADFDGSVWFAQTETGYDVFVEAGSTAESELLVRLENYKFSRTEENAQTAHSSYSQDDSAAYTLYCLVAK